MSTPLRLILGLCVGLLVLAMSASPAQALTIHPAVLKNFVGPFRKQGEPILESNFFERPRMIDQKLLARMSQGSMEQGTNTLQRQRHHPEGHYPRHPHLEGDVDVSLRGQEDAYPVDVRGPALQEEWTRPLRSCKGSGDCGQNMDNTLNLLMRMMETGRR